MFLIVFNTLTRAGGACGPVWGSISEPRHPIKDKWDMNPDRCG